jgi:hypothetical protein
VGLFEHWDLKLTYVFELGVWSFSSQRLRGEHRSGDLCSESAVVFYEADIATAFYARGSDFGNVLGFGVEA